MASLSIMPLALPVVFYIISPVHSGCSPTKQTAGHRDCGTSTGTVPAPPAEVTGEYADVTISVPLVRVAGVDSRLTENVVKILATITAARNKNNQLYTNRGQLVQILREKTVFQQLYDDVTTWPAIGTVCDHYLHNQTLAAAAQWLKRITIESSASTSGGQ